jgi:outer membrane protein
MLRSLTTAAVFLMASLLLSADARAQHSRIGVVDVQRALALTEDGMRASATMKKLFEPRQLELTRRQNELQKVKDELDRQGASLSKAAYAEKMQDLQKQALELQGIINDANKEYEKKQRDLTDPIFEKIMAIVRNLAQTEGFDLIMDRSTATYTRTDLDLTDKCIMAYNAGGPVSTPAPKPAATTPAPVKH